MKTPAPSPRVFIDAGQITDWDTFHSIFAETFGFPDFYGRNLDAWIDSLTSLDAPEDGLTALHTTSGHPVILEIRHADDLAARCPEIHLALLECTDFVNRRRAEFGQGPVLSLHLS